MFGYIRPCGGGKADADQTYKAYYCGLCKCINRDFSLWARAFLNYDCAFLHMAYSSLSPAEPVYSVEGCAFNPLSKKRVARTPEAAYAAGVNLLLVRGKLKDSVADEKSVAAAAGLKLFSRLFARAHSRYYETAREIDAHLAALTAMEEGGVPSPDAASNEFGALLAATAAAAPFDWLRGDVERDLYDFAFNLGKWVYLMDACDDLVSDVKKGRYNPVALRYGIRDEAGLAGMKEELIGMLMFTLKQASYYYARLPLTRNVEAMDSVMYGGLPGVTLALFKKDGKQDNRSKALDGSV